MLLATNPFSIIKHLDLIFLELKHCYFGVLVLCIAVPLTLLSNQIYSRLNKVNLKYFSPVHNQKELSIQHDTITFLPKRNCQQYHKTVLFVTGYVIKLIKNQTKYRQHTALKLSKGHKMDRTQTHSSCSVPVQPSFFMFIHKKKVIIVCSLDLLQFYQFLILVYVC